MDFDAAPDDLKPQIDYIKDLFNFSNDDVRYQWQAWALKQPTIPEITALNLDDFKEHLQANLERSVKRQKMIATPKSTRLGPVKTPKTHHKPSAVPPSDPPSSPAFERFQGRTDAGVVEKNFGQPQDYQPGTAEIKLLPSVPYKTQYTKLSEVTQALDEEVEAVIERLCRAFKLDEAEICNPAISAQHETWAVGRLVALQTFGEGDVSIQTCRRFGSGTLVPLDVAALPSFSFFEGQIVALKGTNPMGDTFVVSQLVEIPRPEITAENEAAKLMFAAGPFTTNDSLDYSPLAAFVTAANEQRPSAVVLMGPFVDPNHPSILAGDVGNAHDLASLFRVKIAPLLQRLEVPAIIVPCGSDDMVGHVPFPHPALPRQKLHIPHVHFCAPNPAKLRVNGLDVSVSNTSILQDLSRFAYRKNSKTEAFRHIIDQQSLYPLFPSPRALDVPNMYQARLDVLPQVLIVPSPMPTAIEEVGGVLCINPGKLSKTMAAGRYAVVTVGRGAGPITARCEAKIVKI